MSMSAHVRRRSLAALLETDAMPTTPGGIAIHVHHAAAQSEVRVVEKSVQRDEAGRIVGVIETSRPASQTDHGEQG
jgi:hypothetical protein